LDTLVSTSDAGWIYFQQKQVDKALPLLEEAIAGLRANFPPLHPERLTTSQILAQAYHAAEQLDKALSLQETVTDQYRTVYGPEDRATQSCIDNLIAFFIDVGACDKAAAQLKLIQAVDENRPLDAKQRQEPREKRFRDLIERIRPAAEKYQQELAAKNAEHPDTLAARQAFAVVLRQQSRSRAAAYHLKAVLEARQRLFHGDSPEAQTCRLELGIIRLEQRKYDEAEPLLLEAYSGLKQHEGATPEFKRSTTEAVQRLVQLYNRWDKKDKADEWRKKLDEQKQ